MKFNTPEILEFIFKRRRLYILCACDRFNYGDLLFPYIINSYFSDIAKIINCSTTQSDMSERGALPTNDFSKLTRMSRFFNNSLIIAGGECLFCDWKTILGYVNNDSQPNEFPTKYPYTISKNELKHLGKVVYNSVGGYQLNEYPELYVNDTNKRILENADYISVRDRVTSLGLSRMNIVHCICADSAILMSKVFNDDFLLGHISETCKKLLSRKYLFFQIGLQHIKEWTTEYARILSEISAKKNIHICMCPIGTALGHDDPEALSLIAQRLSPQIYTLIQNPTIWDIMALIRWSQIYVGTSLHGAITAMSYQIPLIVHGPKKLQIYIETWYDTIGSEYSFVSINDLESAILRRMETCFTISPDKQMESVEKSFKEIRKILTK